MRAARFFGCPPWELARQPEYWIGVAQLCEPAEHEARAYHQKRAEDAQKRASQRRR